MSNTIAPAGYVEISEAALRPLVRAKLERIDRYQEEKEREEIDAIARSYAPRRLFWRPWVVIPAKTREDAVKRFHNRRVDDWGVWPSRAEVIQGRMDESRRRANRLLEAVRYGRESMLISVEELAWLGGLGPENI